MRMPAKALILLAMTSSAVSAGALLDKTDRFTGTRYVAWNSIPENDREFGLSTSAFYPKDASSPTSYSFTLTTYSSAGEYSECHHTAWLIDGQRSTEMEGKYERSADSRVVIERFTTKATRDLLTKVAAAKLVEFKVCGTEGVVSASDLNGVRQVLKVTK